MKILVIDVGGTHVKVLASGHKKRVEIPSGRKMTPAKMVAAVRAATAGWKYDAVSIGYEAVDGHALIYAHKERELAEVEARYPAEHYVMVDDKLRILAVIKKIWGRRVTTVFVRQGHYARDPQMLAARPAADVSIARIGALLNYDLQDFPPRAAQVARGSV